MTKMLIHLLIKLLIGFKGTARNFIAQAQLAFELMDVLTEHHIREAGSPAKHKGLIPLTRMNEDNEEILDIDSIRFE